MQIRICPRCGAKNPISGFSCKNCDTDISMEPFVEQKEPEIKMYKICPACNTHVEVKEKTEIIKFCPVCHSDAIHRVGEEQVEIQQVGDDTPSEDLAEGSESKSVENIKGIILRNKQDGMCVFVSKGKHMIGAYGDCEPDYFWNLQFVSGEHLLINVTEDKILVTDNNSKNHSWVNEERLWPHTEMELMEGDRLKLADQYFEVELCR